MRARVVLLGGGGDLGGKGGQQADQRLLGGVGQHAGVHGVRTLKLHALALQLFNTEQMRAWAYCT